jgi:hypothetical protein
MIGRRSLVGIGLLAAALLLAATTAMASGPARRGPIQGKHHTGRGTTSSSNWSGYAAYGAAFTYVEGSWVVPTADCTGVKRKQTTIASPWVGLDGYNSNTVEQTGTDSDCLGKNAPAYYAWYEFYPAGPVFDNTHTVNAGDHMTAYVSVTGSSVITTLEDWGSTGNARQWTYSGSTSSTGLDFNSAEWILEKPSNTLTTLLGGVTFTGAYATDTSSHTGPIDSADWSNDSISLVNHPGPHGTTLATPGVPRDSGGTSSFTISTG